MIKPTNGKFTFVMSKLIPLEDPWDGEQPPAQVPDRRSVDVNGREEHEAILKDSDKMRELGLDPFYETMVYLKRWGGWLNE